MLHCARCWIGAHKLNRRALLVAPQVSMGGELQDVAVEAEIMECTPQPDGCVCLDRCRPLLFSACCCLK